MFQYMFIILLAVILLLLYCFINNQRAAYWLFRTAIKLFGKVPKKDERTRISELYLEMFREHRQSRMSRNIVVQLLPWFGILALVFILGNQFIYFGTVLSGSMEPTFRKGDLVLMQTVIKEPEVGDIIMFSVRNMEEPVTHRIVSIDRSGVITTQGDANAEKDGWPLMKEHIMGTAVIMGEKPVVIGGLGGVLVPKAGAFTIMNHLPKGMTATVVFQQFRAIAPFVLFFSSIFYFFILVETRMDNDRRFNTNGKNGRKKGVPSKLSDPKRS